MKIKQIKNIVEGCSNLLVLKLFSKVPEKIRLVYLSRKEICNDCSLMKNNTCSSDVKGTVVRDFKYYEEQRKKDSEYFGCGCNLDCKTLVPTENCPLGKWLSIEVHDND